jgi:hypothetical protein
MNNNFFGCLINLLKEIGIIEQNDQNMLGNSLDEITNNVVITQNISLINNDFLETVYEKLTRIIKWMIGSSHFDFLVLLLPRVVKLLLLLKVRNYNNGVCKSLFLCVTESTSYFLNLLLASEKISETESISNLFSSLFPIGNKFQFLSDKSSELNGSVIKAFERYNGLMVIKNLVVKYPRIISITSN